MKVNKVLSNKIYKAFDRARKVSKLTYSEEDLQLWFNTLNYIASLDEQADMVGNHHMDKFKVPTQMQDLVIPRRISVEVSTGWNDIRSASYKKHDSLETFGVEMRLMTPLEFNEVTYGILGGFRKDGDGNTTTITSLNGVAAMDTYKKRFAVISRAEGEPMLLDVVEGYIPVDTDSVVMFMKGRHYNTELSINLENWIESLISKLRSTKQ